MLVRDHLSGRDIDIQALMRVAEINESARRLGDVGVVQHVEQCVAEQEMSVA